MAADVVRLYSAAAFTVLVQCCLLLILLAVLDTDTIGSAAADTVLILLEGRC